MKSHSHILRKTALATAVVLAVGGAPLLTGPLSTEYGYGSLISTAYADEDGSGGGGGGHKGAMGENRGGQGGRGAGGQGYKGGKSITDVLDDEGEEDDSDRPDWAQSPGNEGKPGGGNAGGSTKKGEDYGDLFVILRNDDGTPVTVGGEVYILLSNGEWVLTEDGEVPEGTDAGLLQSVEPGRMNIARSPASVLEHSLTEALSKLDGLVVTPETIDALTDAAGRLVADGATIDSPLENLALYEALLTAPTVDGMLVVSVTGSKDAADATYTLLVDPSLRLDLAASTLAASSDKTGDLTIDEIMLISDFVGVADELSTYVVAFDYDQFATYNTEVEVLVEQPDGSYVPTMVNLYETLSADDGDIYGFNEIERLELVDNPDGTQSLVPDTNTTGIDVFTQAADDAVQTIEFVHEFSM